MTHAKKREAILPNKNNVKCTLVIIAFHECYYSIKNPKGSDSLKNQNGSIYE